MTKLQLNNDKYDDSLPPFSLIVEKGEVCAIYCDPNFHEAFVQYITENKHIAIWHERDALYERLTIEDNLKFYYKWFSCSEPLAEIIVRFKLSDVLKKTVKKCSPSELCRLRYAKYYMANVMHPVLLEPTHGIDDKTIHVCMEMIDSFKRAKKPVLIIVSYLEQALLLAEKTYHLKKDGWKQVEIVEEKRDDENHRYDAPIIDNLFKIQAKLDDKVVLFDPTEIDYIESRDGKSMIIIEKEEFVLDATLTEVEEKLMMYGFFRCHRSYLVNLQKVREIITWSRNTYSLRLNNNSKSTIPLSRAKVKEIQAIFNSP